MGKRFTSGYFDLHYPKKVDQSIWDAELKDRTDKEVHDLPADLEDCFTIGATDDGELICEFRIVRQTIGECRSAKKTIEGNLKRLYGPSVNCPFSAEGSTLR